MSTESVRYALQDLSVYDGSNRISYKLLLKTRDAVQTLASQGLTSTDHAIFLLSAEKLLYFISGIPNPSIAERLSGKPIDNEFTLAIEAVSKQESTLWQIIKEGGSDSGSRQKKEYSIRTLNEIYKNGDKNLRKKLVESYTKMHPFILKGMIEGIGRFDEAVAIYLEKYPFTCEHAVKNAAKIARKIDGKEFCPNLRAILVSHDKNVAACGLEIGEKMLKIIGFKENEVNKIIDDSESNPEYIADNLDTIFLLEQKVQGLPRWLFHARGISHFGRYPAELLIDQLKYVDDSKNPWGIIIYPDSDWTGAFQESIPQLKQILRQVEDLENRNKIKYRLRIVESSNLLSLGKILLRLHYQYGKISFAVVGGHGNKNAIQFGEKGFFGDLTTSDIAEGVGIQKGIKKLFAPDAKIVLNSCDTGKKGGIAQALSRLGLEVLAPINSTTYKGLKLESRGKNTKLVATYFNGDKKNRFRNGKLIRNS